MLKPTKKKINDPLEKLTANMVALYLQAKFFHLNVTGSEFYGAHKTFDGIADLGTAWFDTLAERMRALDHTVCVCPRWVEEHRMLPEVAEVDSDAEAMFSNMLESLQILSDFINTHGSLCDATTGNMLQELDRDIGKQVYFVRSSL